MSDHDAFRLRAARERRGLDPVATAQLADLPLPLYEALEDDDEALWSELDLRGLLRLGRILGIAPLDLLEGASDVGAARPLTALPKLLKEQFARRGTTAAAFAAKSGWPVDDILHDPVRIWTWTALQLAEVGEAAGLDWREYLGHQLPREKEHHR